MYTRKQISGIFLLTISFCAFVTAAWINVRLLTHPLSNIALVETQPTEQVISKPNPARIKIAAINLDKPLLSGSITGSQWLLTDNDILYLNSAANPGENGNIILYGHNRKDLLGPIRWLKVGDEIVITNEANEQFTYRIEKTDTVDPTNLSYIHPTSSEALTMYTCTGLLDEKRFIVRAVPVL